MDLLQLEHFIAVCEERTFTRAAERVFRTQSAVSQSIKKLEDEVGSPLFARDTEIVLTEAGEVILDYARRMLVLRDIATRKVEALKNLSAGSLTVGAHEAAATYLLPNPVRSFRCKFPDIKVSIYNIRMDEIPTRVLDRDIDIGFVDNDAPTRALHSVQVYSDKMILIAPPEHRLASRQMVSIKDLGSELFISRNQCTSTMQKISQIFQQYDVPYRVVTELWSFENVKSFVREGVGLAIVPGMVARAEIQNGFLVQIPVLDLVIDRRGVMIYRDQGYMSEPAHQLIEARKTIQRRGSVFAAT